MQRLSYSYGANDIPLKGETIGESLRQTMDKYGSSEALVMAPQDYRATYQEFWGQVEEVAA